MRLFYKKKTAKPTAKESEEINRRLLKKYPQMYETATSEAQQSKLAGLSPGDRKELERMIGKRLKRKYRK